MEYRYGKLIDHVHLRVRDVGISKAFYSAILRSLGQSLGGEGPDYFWADELFVDKADGSFTRIHLAFQARDRSAVEAFYKAGLAAGGRDNGAPGERHYHQGYYAAFLLDPDENNIEAVYHGPSTRSAEAVIVIPTDR